MLRVLPCELIEQHLFQVVQRATKLEQCRVNNRGGTIAKGSYSLVLLGAGLSP